MPRRNHIVFAMTGAERVPGGIAALNLNVIPALDRLAVQKDRVLQVFSLLEADADRPSTLPDRAEFRGFAGSKKDFGMALQKAALHASLVTFDHVALALPLLPLAVARAVTTTIFAHGSEAWRKPHRTSRWSLRAAKLCLANSAYTLRRLHEHLNGINGAVCDLGLSPRFALHDAVPAPPERPIALRAVDGREREIGEKSLLLVGRIDPDERGKGHYALVKALPRLREKHPNVQLVFPGPGDGRESVAHTAGRLGVDDAVFMPGFVDVDVLQHLYRRCYAYTMPSRQEGFGLVYLEAMNYGKPCLGCYEDGAEAIIIDGETGILIPDPKSTGELIHRLDALLSNPDGAREMGRRGFERLHERFTAEHVQQRILNHLEPLI